MAILYPSFVCTGSHSQKNFRAHGRWPETSLREVTQLRQGWSFFQRTTFQNHSQRWKEWVPLAPGEPRLTLLKICRPSWPPDTYILPSNTVTPAALRLELIGVTTVHLQGRARGGRGAMRLGVAVLPGQLRRAGVKRGVFLLTPHNLPTSAGTQNQHVPNKAPLRYRSAPPLHCPVLLMGPPAIEPPYSDSVFSWSFLPHRQYSCGHQVPAGLPW